MIVCVLGTKGGIGKSTIAVQLVTGLHLAGRRVLAVDADGKQTSMLLALTDRSNNGKSKIDKVDLSDAGALRAQVPLQAEKYDDVVVDVGAKDSAALRSALSVADLVLVPFPPRSFDVWALPETVRLIEEMQKFRHFAVRMVLNRAESRGTENGDAISVVEELGYDVLPCVIGDRKSISHASAAGLNITEYPGATAAAKKDVAGLIDSVLALI